MIIDHDHNDVHGDDSKDFDCFYKPRLTNSLKGGKMEPSIHDTARHIQVLLVIMMLMMMMHCDSDDDAL